MIEYESQLNYLLAKSRKVVRCQYDENIFSKDVLLGAVYIHPKVIMSGVLWDNKYYIPPEEFFSGAKKYKDHTSEDLRDNLLAEV